MILLAMSTFLYPRLLLTRNTRAGVIVQAYHKRFHTPDRGVEEEDCPLRMGLKESAAGERFGQCSTEKNE